MVYRRVVLNDLELADELSDVLVKAGAVDEKTELSLRKVSDKYNLNTRGLERLSAEPILSAPIIDHPTVHRVHMPFMGFSVNSWIFLRGSDIILIDTGEKADAILEKLKELNVTPTHLMITHNDPDHVGGFWALMKKYPDLTPAPCQLIETGGHCMEHSSFYFPDERVCFCGDALFAGSMGRPNISYEQSRKSVNKLLDLPEETSLFSGHGPATTVARERKYNCFA